MEIERVASLPFGASEELRVSVRSVMNRRVLDFRVFTSLAQTPESIPTGKGFWIPLSRWSEFKNFLDQVDAAVPPTSPSSQ